jgi:hypothetical protein
MYDKKFVEWLASGERGISSNTIASVLSGLDCMQGWGYSHPRDPADFKRCLFLLYAVPGFSENLSKMGDVSPEWAALVEHWQEFEKLLHSELAEDTGRAPKTYARMQEILEDVRQIKQCLQKG